MRKNVEIQIGEVWKGHGASIFGNLLMTPEYGASESDTIPFKTSRRTLGEYANNRPIT